MSISIHSTRPVPAVLTTRARSLYSPAYLEANEVSPHIREQGNIFMSIVEATEYYGNECIPANVAPYENCINGMIAAVDM